MGIPDGYKAVSVRAFERKGYEGFCRGGRRWPTDGTVVLVTPKLLSVLLTETKLAVDQGPNLDGVSIDSLERLDLPKPTYVDEGARALEEAAKLRQQIAIETALAESASLRAQLAALKSANAAKGDATDKGKKDK